MQKYDIEIIVQDDRGLTRGVVLFDTCAYADRTQGCLWRYADIKSTNELIRAGKINLQSKEIDEFFDGDLSPSKAEIEHMLKTESFIDTILGNELCLVRMKTDNVKSLLEDDNNMIATFEQVKGGAIRGKLLYYGQAQSKVRDNLRRSEYGKANANALLIGEGELIHFNVSELEYGLGTVDAARWKDVGALCSEIRKLGVNLIIDRATKIKEHVF
jgi:hypothetical protein